MQSKTSKSNEYDAIKAEFENYAYSVSHDLSAPVRAMVEFSKLLTNENQESLNDEAKEYLSIITENGQKLQDMMSGLLQYSRLNTMANEFLETDVNAVLRNCIYIMDKQLKESGATIEFDRMPTLNADAEQLTQLFCIIIDNAVKFQPTEQKPVIKISATQKENYWQFTIQDNGIGIDSKYQDKIFKLFSRLHTDDEYKGIGIGLTLAKKIVKRHGGEIWYEKTPATMSGTIFHFLL